MAGKLTFLTDLERVFDERIASGKNDSYVRGLILGELDRLLKKIGEEAGEVIIASKNGDKVEVLNESADLLFHLMLVLKKQGYSIEDVVDVLAQRHNA